MIVETLVGAAITVTFTSAGYLLNLGSRVTTIEERTRNFESWLSRVEDKLDQVISNSRHTR